MVYALNMCCILQVYMLYITTSTYLVLALVTSSSILIEQSISKKSIKIREHSTNLSACRICISLPVKSLICCTRMSMHKWYSSVCRSPSHSVVWATVAALDMAGIIPRSLQALPDTVCQSVVGVAAGHCKEQSISIYMLCIYN
jgi:hypothetical protein